MSDDQMELEFSTDVRTNYVEAGEPGLRHDVPFSNYAALQAINSGSVTHGTVSMLRMREALLGRIPNEDTLARRFGRGTHSAILTPGDFEKEFLISKPCGAILKSGARKGMSCGASSKCVTPNDEWFCGTHAEYAADVDFPENYLSPDEVLRIRRIRESLHSHFLNDLLRAKGWSEVSIVWKWTDLTLKGRLDRYTDCDRPYIIDLKTCQSGKGRREDCQKSIAEYSWHRQAAMYVHGVEALTGKRPEFIWLFIEKTEPFDVQIIPASAEDIEIGWREVENVLAAYQNCCNLGRWPGYVYSEETIQVGGLPTWFVKQARDGYS